MLGYIFGFLAFVGLTSRLEYWALHDLLWLILFVPIILTAWYALHRFQQETIEIDKRLISEEKQPVAFEVLDLGHWS